MKRINNNVRACATALLMAVVALCSCSDETELEYDPYTNWAERNAIWYAQICDSARLALNDQDSIAMYGEEAWKNERCEWRMYKSLLRAPGYNSGLVSDSICVHIRQRGTDPDAFSPAYTDSVRLNFAGWLMETTYEEYDGTIATYQKSFTKSYVGDFNPNLAAPQLMSVASTVEGFCTALQYMKAGDTWDVYMPSRLAYGSTGNATIPAYSTLLFRINMVAAYRSGSGIPEWK